VLSNTPSNIITTSASASQAASALSSVPSTPSTLLSSEQCLFAAELHIPSNMLRTGAPLSLQANYLRYLVYLETSQKLEDIKKSGTWPSGLKMPTSMDIILLFIGKSTWYDSWTKTFPAVVKYPEMVKWLKSEEGHQSDMEVWGVVQNVYHFPDLVTWLENGGTLAVEKKGKKEKKGKGKEKEKVSHKAGSSKAGRK